MPDKKNPPWRRTLLLNLALANAEVHRDFKSNAEVDVFGFGPHGVFLLLVESDWLLSVECTANPCLFTMADSIHGA